ncbi:MAG: hypothetical protein Q8K72_03745, partial [Acidimicrobiales bacterium]|nr:hypothetical protein [Acidimicrobiales bacterium]
PARPPAHDRAIVCAGGDGSRQQRGLAHAGLARHEEGGSVSMCRRVNRRTEPTQRFVPTDDPVLSGDLHLPLSPSDAIARSGLAEKPQLLAP